MNGPCMYSTRDRWDGIPATTEIDCGPRVGMVPACDECAAMYARMTKAVQSAKDAGTY